MQSAPEPRASQGGQFTNPWGIEIQGVVRHFGKVKALDGVSLQIGRGEFFSLLGPSGCGKTTLLRIIAGLDWPDMGTLVIEGENTTQVPAYKRPVNTVFQSYALFPHMSVLENIAFGLRMKGIPGAELTQRVKDVMELVQVTDLGKRRPSQLSGGQRQRVALARAIVNVPKVLLLDEPLGALDLKLRKQLQLELRRLQRRLGMTFVYVTHDQEEALAMSDRVAVMNEGRIEQMGIPTELYDYPRTRFVAGFVGSSNIVEGTIVASRDGESEVRTTFGILSAPVKGPCGNRVTLAFRPEKLRLIASAPAANSPNQWRAKVLEVQYSGAETSYRLRTENYCFAATCMNTRSGGTSFYEGDTVTCLIESSAIVIIPS